jgi:serine/threonine protein kinase
MLESFRRGVKAMQILSERRVQGVVAYHGSWEIPACTVMDYIDGFDVQTAVESSMICEWSTRLRIAVEVVSILRCAHNVPEHVLHRDVRPANIMLKGFADKDDAGAWEVVILDFDLCWHRDATGNSVDVDSVSKGYHAPEQIDHKLNRTRRSALVDSYGVGMTLYYIGSSKHPLPMQVNFINWEKDLSATICSRGCSQWNSLPTRFARLIFWATQPEQHKRWDLTRIQGELQALRQCLEHKWSDLPAEIVAEEVANRCPRFGANYIWDIDSGAAESDLPLGLTIRVQGDEAKRLLVMSITWSNRGDQHYNTVTKYVLPSVDKVLSVFRKAGEWKLDHSDRNFDRMHIVHSIPVSKLVDMAKLGMASNTIASALNQLKLS